LLTNNIKTMRDMNAINRGTTEVPEKPQSIWDRLYQEYKGYYTREEIDEMTFAELGELIVGLETSDE